MALNLNGPGTGDMIQWPTPAAEALRALVAQEGGEVYLNTERVMNALIESGESAVSVSRHHLALTTGILQKYVGAGTPDMTQTGVNNILIAFERGGLKREYAAQCAAEMLYSLSVPQVLTEELVKQAGEDENFRVPDLYVPGYVYEEALGKYETMAEEDEEMDGSQLSELNAFHRSGVGRASFLLAKIYGEGLCGVEQDRNAESGYLEAAKKAGYTPAFALAADAAFERNEYDEAYRTYVMPGSVALDAERRDNVRKLLKAGNFTKKCMISLFLLLGISEIFIWAFAGASPVTGPHIVCAVLCTLLNLLAAGAAALYHRNNPMQDIRSFALVTALIDAVFAAVVLL